MAFAVMGLKGHSAVFPSDTLQPVGRRYTAPLADGCIGLLSCLRHRHELAPWTVM